MSNNHDYKIKALIFVNIEKTPPKLGKPCGVGLILFVIKPQRRPLGGLKLHKYDIFGYLVAPKLLNKF